MPLCLSTSNLPQMPPYEQVLFLSTINGDQSSSPVEDIHSYTPYLPGSRVGSCVESYFRHALSRNCHKSYSWDSNTVLSYFNCSDSVGCPSPSLSTTPVIIKEAKKLTIPHFDPSKMTWSSFTTKLHATLIECNTAYLLKETHTTPLNSRHSKELMLELFKKVQGSTICLFTGMHAQHIYMEAGCGKGSGWQI